VIVLADPECEDDKVKYAVSTATQQSAGAGLEIALNTVETRTIAFSSVPEKCAQWLTYTHTIDEAEWAKNDLDKEGLVTRDGLTYTWAATKKLALAVDGTYFEINARSIQATIVSASIKVNWAYSNPCHAKTGLTVNTDMLPAYVLGEAAVGKIEETTRVTGHDPAWCSELLTEVLTINPKDKDVWGDLLANADSLND